MHSCFANLISPAMSRNINKQNQNAKDVMISVRHSLPSIHMFTTPSDSDEKSAMDQR